MQEQKRSARFAQARAERRNSTRLVLLNHVAPISTDSGYAVRLIQIDGITAAGIALNFASAEDHAIAQRNDV